MRGTAVVTGANRGLGWHTAQQLGQLGYTVVCTTRRLKEAEQTAEALVAQGLDAVPYVLDVRLARDAEGLARELKARWGGVDVLVNNAGVFLDDGVRLFELDDETLETTLQTNLLGPLYLCRALIPMMMARGYGRVVNLSSGYGALSQMGPRITAYRVSKAGLNALTAVMAAEVAGMNIKVNAVCPGWVRTDMGGPQAHRDPAEAASDVVWAATLEEDGPSGAFLRYRQPIPW
ncbi:SDR family NAD(P)-dependent oxidoreductase [Ferrimonas balearica]|uniref:SDR family NAD(P)-dependent oxidoreductase n=1 Tax=Ferrimonas balearica TaxID=44012 RepID=UPI001C9A0C42|nr:SDR family NAD(P)-dependent oxidoreductase [Ferrimonas balearica]MBY5992670.1 SDR family NAD(P)-dependent oxidoreductase [Ferrimonas balearica]